MSTFRSWLLPAGAVLALALAVTAARGEVSREAALFDALLLAALAALLWQAARRLYGPAGATGAGLAALLSAPLLGAVGGGALLAALLTTLALLLFGRCLLDPTLQLVAAAGVALGGALAALAADGAAPGPAAAVLCGTALLLAAWRVITAERCEPRTRVARAALSTVLLAMLLAAGMNRLLALLPAVPEATDYGLHALWVPVHGGELAQRPPALLGNGWLLLNLGALLLCAGVRAWRAERRYADGVSVIAFAGGAALAWLAHAPVLLAVLTAPWLALLAGGAWSAGASRPRTRLALVLLALEALSAVLLWPDYPRATAGWPPPLLAAVAAPSS